MELMLRRYVRDDKYTIGILLVNGTYVCDTCEDKDRGLRQTLSSDDVIQKAKVFGKTAIPTGRYEIDLNTVSPKYKDKAAYQFIEGKLPRLINVPGYAGVLIHQGNSEDDTEGCILVGTQNLDKQSKLRVTNSAKAFKLLMEKLAEKKEEEKIYITIA